MSKICVCIEGQLRGAETCGPTIRKHLIEKLNADLYFFIQKYSEYKHDDLKYYGVIKKYVIYDNPIPNFSNHFDQLCNFYKIDNSIWRKTFEIMKNENYKLGFDKPGTCIRRMFNRYVIYNDFKHLDYEWYIIMRSDLFFLDDFNIDELNEDCLNISQNCNFRGYNNNLIVFHKKNIDKILNYIINFLNGELLNKYLHQYNNQDINEETFFKMSMDVADVKINYLKNTWFISANSVNDTNTWNTEIKKSELGHIYKYDDYIHAINNVKNRKNN